MLTYRKSGIPKYYQHVQFTGRCFLVRVTKAHDHFASLFSLSTQTRYKGTGNARKVYPENGKMVQELVDVQSIARAESLLKEEVSSAKHRGKTYV